MRRLGNKVAIVTGGGQGIGKGVARALAADGARVVIANRSADAGEAVAAEIERDFGDHGARALYVRTDVSEQESVRALVETTVGELGGIDILVNNATPTGSLSRFEYMDNAAMEQHLRVNYYGCLWTMQAAFPYMKAKGWGRIINMASLNGVNAHKYSVMYNGSKEALRTLTRTAAVEWGRYGITCNVLCPAAATPPWEMFKRLSPRTAKGLVMAMPLQRMGTAEEDIGPVTVFLASDASRYVTGNTIHADGGGHISGVPWKFKLPESQYWHEKFGALSRRIQARANRKPRRKGR